MKEENMMIELKLNDYYLVESFFTEKKQYIPALSVIHGNFPGRVFVNQIHEPNIAIVWATGRWMYLEGNTKSDKDQVELNSFISDVVVPDCKQLNTSWFEIYTADVECWEALFLGELHLLKVEKHYESVYTLNLEKYIENNNVTSSSLDDIKISLCEHEILPRKLHDLSYVDQKFKTKTCPAVELRSGNELITICRNNGFVFLDEYFIDVDTFEEEQRGKGYARLAAIRLIDHLLKKRMIPLWETTHQNVPSHHLALKLGFEVKDSYPVYAFMLES